jgi:hypothetical protein
MPYAGERRAGRERRTANVGPPQGVKERRRGRDRRALSIAEVEIPVEEWDRYFAGKASATGSAAAE